MADHLTSRYLDNIYDPLHYQSSLRCQFLASYGWFKAHHLDIALSFSNKLFFFFFTAIGRQRYYLICVSIALLIKIAANFILIPKIDYLASCWATILADTFHYWICMVLLKKVGFHFNSIKLIGIPALGGVLSGLCLYLGRSSSSIFHILPFVGLAFIVYVGILSLFRYITKDEIFSLISPKEGDKKGDLFTC